MRLLISVLLLLVFRIDGFCQERIYFDHAWDTVSMADAIYIRVQSKVNDAYKFKDYKIIDTALYREGSLVSVGGKLVMQGNIYCYYKDGKISGKSIYLKGKPIGNWLEYDSKGNVEIKKVYKEGVHIADTSYYTSGLLKSVSLYDEEYRDYTKLYESGNVKRVEKYKGKERIEGKCFSEKGEDIDFYPEAINAKTPVDMHSYIQEQMNKSGLLHDFKGHGKTTVVFVVEKDGSIQEVKLLGSSHPRLDLEVIEILKNMPKWTPAIYENEPVREYFSMPVNFKF